MKLALPLLIFALLAVPAIAQETFEKDVVPTAGGNLEM